MKEALGLVEIRGMSTAIVAADTMVKTANVHIIGLENTRGLGYITIKVAGDVGAVTAAVEAGKKIGMISGLLISAKVIPRPADAMASVFIKEQLEKPKNKSKKEIKKRKTPQKAVLAETSPKKLIKDKTAEDATSDQLQSVAKEENTTKGKDES